MQVRTTPLGRGVFALKSFDREETVGQVTGRFYDDPEHDSRYCVDVGDGWTLEPRSPFRFLNHACVPNCQFVYTEEAAADAKPGQPARTLFVETLRPIEAGEELYIDYAWTADAAIPCLCGLPECRGWIVAPDELADLLKANAELEAAAT